MWWLRYEKTILPKTASVTITMTSGKSMCCNHMITSDLLMLSQLGCQRLTILRDKKLPSCLYSVCGETGKATHTRMNGPRNNAQWFIFHSRGSVFCWLAYGLFVVRSWLCSKLKSCFRWLAAKKTKYIIVHAKTFYFKQEYIYLKITN